MHTKLNNLQNLIVGKNYKWTHLEEDYKTLNSVNIIHEYCTVVQKVWYKVPQFFGPTLLATAATRAGTSCEFGTGQTSVSVMGTPDTDHFGLGFLCTNNGGTLLRFFFV